MMRVFRRNKKGEPATTGAREVDIQKVRNPGIAPQIIGKVVIRPGGMADLDVAPGTIGAGLVARGELVIEKPKKAKAEPVAIEPGVSFVCPWCGEATDERVGGQIHILEQHGDAILAYYGETFRARDLNPKANVSK